MSMYIENNLGKDEAIVIKAQKNPLYLLVSTIWVAIFLTVACVLTGVCGLKISYNRAACAVIAEKELQVEFDVLSEEYRQSFLESNGVSDRKELKQKKTDDMYREVEELEKQAPGMVSQLMNELLTRYDLNGGQVIAEMLKPVFTYVGWFAFAISALVFLSKISRFCTCDLALTNKRVVGRIGLLKKRVMDIHIDKIDNVQIKSGLFGSLMKYYTISVKCASGDAGEVGSNFVGIRNAQDFKDRTNDMIEQHAEEARKAQAAEIARAMGGKSDK